MYVYFILNFLPLSLSQLLIVRVTLQFHYVTCTVAAIPTVPVMIYHLLPAVATVKLSMYLNTLLLVPLLYM